ncbi:MAG: type II toxin-antitoxin system HicA family toxin [Thermodesulfobacteriota bacterium]|nr:type II toxin-antitoxin system HicA family toxin [Thermodesulfobacteriota bacterium]
MYCEIEKQLTKMGYSIVLQKGSHVIFSDGKNIFSVPNHGSKDISIGVEKQLLKILNLTAIELKNVK